MTRFLLLLLLLAASWATRVPPASAQQPPREEEEESPVRPARPSPAPGDEAAPEQTKRSADLYDIIYWRQNELAPLQTTRVVLLQEFLGRKIPSALRGEKHAVRLFTQSGTARQTIVGWQIDEIVYYEDRLLKQAAELLGTKAAELKQSGRTIAINSDARAEKATAAAELLTAAIAEHDSAVERGLRRGDVWNKECREPLVAARLNLQLSRVDALLTGNKAQEAEVECDRLVGELPPRSPLLAEVHSRLERIFVDRARAAFEGKDYAAARTALRDLATRYPGAEGAAVRSVDALLRAEAAAVVRQAEEVRKQSPSQAIELLDRAAEIHPGLATIDEVRRAIGHPILHCAYGELPAQVSPFGDGAAVERHVAAIIFDSLVRWVDDPQAGGHYAPHLAAGRAAPLVRGRGFRLQRAFWADGAGPPKPLSIEDIRWTVKLLKDPRCPGYSPAYASLLGAVDNAPDDDPLRALVRLERDHWQPLSLMDFRVLPAHRFPQGGTPEEWQQFLTQPVGTGPYQLPSLGDADSDQCRLVANPLYRKPRQPHIREIVLHRMDSAEAIRQLQRDKIHLIYDVRREHVAQLNRRLLHTLRTPTVWMLAPNYRNKALQNPNLRLAIAHAIDREAILSQHFPVISPNDRAALTGPYPAGCWAYNAAVPEYKVSKAQGFAEQARKELGDLPAGLRLSYPWGGSESEAVQEACKQIRDQVQRSTGIALELVRLPPREFYRRVRAEHDFDLAYWGHTYEDATYWIEPLLDAAADAQSAGMNFMSYAPDAELAEFFRAARLHKAFAEIQRLTHKIHEHVNRRAVVIPLWQLDTYVAMSELIRGARLDPFAFWDNIDEWELIDR